MVPAAVKKATKKIVKYPEHDAKDISSKDWLARFWTNPLPQIKSYILSLFPILTWIHRYNLGWLSGDVIAGVTVGIVVIPQAMSYAQIALLSPEYGLYSSFVGVSLYCIFATSKDVSIGPTAVLSLTVANVVKHVQQDSPGQWDNPTIATTVGLATGIIHLMIGLLRLGWLVEFIPMPTISAFMTGSAITICATQIPGLLGISGFDTRASTYKILLNSIKGLPRTKLDAAWGIPALFLLYGVRYACDWAAKKWPRRARLFFFLGVMRNAVVLVLFTIIGYIYCRNRRDSNGAFPITILMEIPSGLKRISVPRVHTDMLTAMAPELPVTAVICFLEHIAISKAFGRLNGYKINPNQELISIGVANTVGGCFGAFPGTGSFSRSALQSKSGGRSPLGGIFTAIVVIVALYGLTDAFFWIPNASLCAVVIHSVADLVAFPDEVYQYWRFSPPEFFVWVVTLAVILFVSLQSGIYISVAISICILLYRIAHPRGSFLGKVSVESDGQQGENREVFIPLKKDDINNPRIRVTPPAPGVLIYRFEESYLFPNASIINSSLVNCVQEKMRRGKDLSTIQLRDRPWNDGGPRKCSDLAQVMNERKPWLHAIVLDFSTVSQLDTTAAQALVDTRAEIERWTEYPVEFHFSTILSPWIRRSLITAGFGYGTSHSKVQPEVAVVGPYRVEMLPDEVAEPADDIEKGEITTEVRHQESHTDLKGWEPLLPVETPFFHVDLASAVRAAESGLDRTAQFGHRKEEREEEEEEEEED